MPTAAAAGAAPVLAASSPAAAQSVYMPTAAAAVVAARVLNVAAAADLDILVGLMVLDSLPLDIDDNLGPDILALDILDFEVEDILFYCVEAAAVGSPGCLMLVCRIPDAVGILTSTSSFLGFVLLVP